MPVWKLEPYASPLDTRWQDRPRYRRLIVRARTSGLARYRARGVEVEESPRVQLGNESAGAITGVEDEKLYRCIRLSPQDAAAYGGEQGPDAVLHIEREDTPGAAA